MKKIVNVRKALRGLTMALALSMAVSGCSFGDKTNTKSSESSYEVQTGDIIEETHEHTHNHDNIGDTDEDLNDRNRNEDGRGDVDRPDNQGPVDSSVEEESTRKGVVKDKTGDKSIDTKKDDTSIVVNTGTLAMYDEEGRLIIPDLSEQFNNLVYTQNSIIKALKLAGFNSSYEYRALLAQHFGIERYRGTAEQNLLLLHYLRHPELFLGQDDISHSDEYQNTEDNGNGNTNTNTNNNGNGNGNGNGNNGNGNGNGNGSGNGSGQDDEDKDQGRWVVTNTVYRDIPGDDTNHLVIKEERNTKTGQTRTTSTLEAHNYNGEKCTKCSHTKKQEQEDKHNLTGSVVKSYSDNGDAGHTVTEKQYCSTHNTYEVINSYTEAHTPGEWKVNPDNPNEEIQVCTKGGCGHIIARRPVQTEEHNYTGAIRKEYEEKDNSVHTVTEYQYCTTHGKEEVIKTYEEAHELGDWEQDPLDPTKEIQVCKHCGEIVNVRDKTQTEDHNYTGAIRKEYDEKDSSVHIVTEYQYCTTHGKEEIIKTYEEAHELGDWEPHPTDENKEVRKCKHCGEIVETRDKQVEDCKHEDTRVEITYEFDSNGQHIKVETTYCNDCGEQVGEPVKTAEPHTPTDAGTTTIVAGKGDKDGHYEVTTYTCARCGHTYTSEERYVSHGNESYTQVGDPIYTPATNEAGEEGHTVVYTYRYDKCGFEFTSEPVFERCTNVDGECQHCHRPITPEHTHNEDGTKRIVRTGDETGFCYKVVHYCTEHPDDEDAQRIEVVTEHKEMAVEIPGNNRQYDIYCSECNMYIRTVQKSQVGDIPVQDSSNSATAAVDLTATYDVDSSKLILEDEDSVEVIDIKVDNNPKEDVVDEENLENSEKEVENQDSELYNEYVDIVDEYFQSIDSESEEVVEEDEEVVEQQLEGAPKLTLSE